MLVTAARTPLGLACLVLLAVLLAAGCVDSSAEPPPNASLRTQSAPVAVAAYEAVVLEGGNVIIDATASHDPDGEVVAYAWRQLAGPVVTWTPAAASRVGFMAPDVVDNQPLVLQLAVTDDDGLIGTTRIDLLVIDLNESPVADAGADREVLARAVVTLSGAASSDADGSVSAYLWQQLDGPSVALDSLSGSGSGISVSFTVPDVTTRETLTFDLTVIDAEGRRGRTTLHLFVEPVVASLRWVTEPPTAVLRNAAFAPALQVELRNAADRVITGGRAAATLVTLLASAVDGSVVAVGGTAAVAAIAGQATFPAAHATATVSAVTLQASIASPALSVAATQPMVVTWPSALPGLLACDDDLRFVDAQALGAASNAGSDLVVAGSLVGTADLDPDAARQSSVSAPPSKSAALVARYGGDGTLRWTKLIAGVAADVRAAAVTVFDDADDAGVVVVAVDYDSAGVDADPAYGDGAQALLVHRGGRDIGLVGLASEDGAWIWSATLGGAVDDTVAAMAALDATTVLVAGDFQVAANLEPCAAFAANHSAAGSGSQAYVVRFDSRVVADGCSGSSALVWAYTAGSSSGGDAHLTGLASIAGERSAVYAVGAFTGDIDFDPDPDASDPRVATAPEAPHAMVLALDANADADADADADDGVYAWVRAFDGAGTSDARAIAADASGRVFVVGSFDGVLQSDAAAVAAGDGAGSITAAGGRDAYVASYTADGAERFLIAVGGPLDDAATHVTVVDDAGGHEVVVVCGTFQGTAQFQGVRPVPWDATAQAAQAALTATAAPNVVAGFIIALDAWGRVRTVGSWESTQGSSHCDALAAGGVDELFAAGHLVAGGTSDLDPGPTRVEVTAGSGVDAYLLKVAADLRVIP